MTIKVKHIHNKQAVGVKGSDWKIAFRNQSQFDFTNAKLNGMVMRAWSAEQTEAFLGNY